MGGEGRAQVGGLKLGGLGGGGGGGSGKVGDERKTWYPPYECIV